MGRDNGPIALVLGNKGRSEALSWLPRNVLQTQRKSTLEDFESVITNPSHKNAALRRSAAFVRRYPGPRSLLYRESSHLGSRSGARLHWAKKQWSLFVFELGIITA